MGLRGHKTAAAVDGQAVRVLVALVGSSHIAFPAPWVRGIITPAEAGPHEQITWVNSTFERTDLARRLAFDHHPPGADARIILYGNDQRARSFMVDGVVGLVDVSRSQVQPLPPQFRGGERERVLGIFISPTYVALITNPFWVLELPSRANVLDAFVLPLSDSRMAEFDSKLRLANVREDAAPAGLSR